MPDQHYHLFKDLGANLLSSGIYHAHADPAAVVGELFQENKELFIQASMLAAHRQALIEVTLQLSAVTQALLNVESALAARPAPAGDPTQILGGGIPESPSPGKTPIPAECPEGLDGKAHKVILKQGVTHVEQCLDYDFIESLKGCGPVMSKGIVEWAHKTLGVPIDGADPVPSSSQHTTGFAPAPAPPGVG